GAAKIQKSSEAFSLIEITTSQKFLKGIKTGASVSVDGVCLTVTKIKKSSLCFDVIAETLKLTNLNELEHSKKVNLERSMKLSDEIGGHLLSGHIQTTGKIIKKISLGDKTIDLKVAIPKKFAEYLMSKGYIGVNGCSLTIGKVASNHFMLHLIPETLAVTNLDIAENGDVLNIEIDQNTISIVETGN
ncbi:MAG: riboflavin synthase subunit alpha, partial [Proteobacteria bacterium]|nr:riboflavin synthase subunit alpha [Pseudomonadota bacterium]